MKTEVINLQGNDSIKVLFFTDTHFTAKSPKNRKDNLLETAIKKTEEFVELANSLKVDFCLHGGDLFDTPHVSDMIAGKVAKILKKLNCRLFGVAGNHDLYGNNLDKLYNTKLGLLHRVGIIDILIHPNEDMVIFNKGDSSLQLTGTSSHFGIDVQNIKEDYIISNKNAKYALHVIHGMLMPKAFIPGAHVVTIDDIKETVADVTLAGHYHIGFKPVLFEDKLFINPGALVRKNNDQKEIDRMPNALLIEFGEKVTYKNIPLDSVQPGDEVLDRTEILKRNAQDIKINNFLGEIRRTSEVKSLNIHSIIQEISQNRNLPEKVVNVAVQRIGKIQELLNEE